jgi:hypothetical protein
VLLVCKITVENTERFHLTAKKTLLIPYMFTELFNHNSTRQMCIRGCCENIIKYRTVLPSLSLPNQDTCVGLSVGTEWTSIIYFKVIPLKIHAPGFNRQDTSY